jgi:hypothetical protein
MQQGDVRHPRFASAMWVALTLLVTVAIWTALAILIEYLVH